MVKALVIFLGLLSMGALSAQDTSLLKTREWTSNNGKALNASLVSVKGDSITLKRKSDSREFSLPLARLSDEDQTLLHNCRRDLESMAEGAGANQPGASSFFTGFSNPGEDMWELASRFGVARKLWERATQSAWFGVPRGGHRVIRLTPQRFERISDVEYFIHGEYVSLKIRLEQLDEKLNLTGDRLVRITANEKKTIAQEDVVFLPQISRENLVSLSEEKVGVVDRLVMTISLGR